MIQSKSDYIMIYNTELMFYNHISAMLIIDALTGRIVDANPAAERFYGYSLDEFKSLNIDKINTLQQDELHMKMKSAILNEKNHFSFKHRLKDGTIKDVEVYASPVSNVLGNQFLLSIVREKLIFNSWESIANLDERFKVIDYLLNNRIGDFSIGSQSKIAEQTGLSVTRVGSFLKLLEEKDVIKRHGNGVYKLQI